jgi:hypothetical protein
VSDGYDDDPKLSDELETLLGPEGFLAVVEAHGGVRMYVPEVAQGSQLASEIGLDNTVRLSKLYARSYIRVPLAREFRARHYRELGETNSRIARRLGITETGVNKLFRRDPKVFVGKKKDPRQIEMF